MAGRAFPSRGVVMAPLLLVLLLLGPPLVAAGGGAEAKKGGAGSAGRQDVLDKIRSGSSGMPKGSGSGSGSGSGGSKGLGWWASQGGSGGWHSKLCRNGIYRGNRVCVNTATKDQLKTAGLEQNIAAKVVEGRPYKSLAHLYRQLQTATTEKGAKNLYDLTRRLHVDVCDVRHIAPRDLAEMFDLSLPKVIKFLSCVRTQDNLVKCIGELGVLSEVGAKVEKLKAACFFEQLSDLVDVNDATVAQLKEKLNLDDKLAERISAAKENAGAFVSEEELHKLKGMTRDLARKLLEKSRTEARNINNATKEELKAVDGIGDETADKIIQKRSEVPK